MREACSKAGEDLRPLSRPARRLLRRRHHLPRQRWRVQLLPCNVGRAGRHEPGHWVGLTHRSPVLHPAVAGHERRSSSVEFGRSVDQGQSHRGHIRRQYR